MWIDLDHRSHSDLIYALDCAGFRIPGLVARVDFGGVEKSLGELLTIDYIRYYSLYIRYASHNAGIGNFWFLV